MPKTARRISMPGLGQVIPRLIKNGNKIMGAKTNRKTMSWGTEKTDVKQVTIEKLTEKTI